MKLSAKTEYGCLAMLHLAEQHPSGEPVQIRRVAAEHDIPWRFLVQILLELKRAGLVTSTRGASGGYRLSRPPEEISLGDVVGVLEGAAAESAPDPPASGLRAALLDACMEAQAAQQERLANISLAELLQCAGGNRDTMWYI